MSDKQQCSEIIRRGPKWHRYSEQCPNAAKVERDGKFYCKVHDPARQEHKAVRWELEGKISLALAAVEITAGKVVDAAMEACKVSMLSPQANEALTQACKAHQEALDAYNQAKQALTDHNNR